MYTESGIGKTQDKPNNTGHIDVPRELKDPILQESASKLAALKREVGSSLLKGEKSEDSINDIFSGLSREEQIAVLRSLTESQEQIEKNLTEAQNARIEQVEIFSALLIGLQNALDGQNDAAFGKMSLWMAQKMQSADLENLKQFLEKFDPVDVSAYIIQDKDKTLYSYISENYPGQMDMLKRLTYHSAIPFYGTGTWGHQNREILADVHNKNEVTKYRNEVVSFLRSDDSLGHYEMARSLVIEGLHDKFEAHKGKIDERKIREETDQKMKKEFGREWEEATLETLKSSLENKGKTEEELRTTINTFRQGMEQQTFKHLKEETIGQMIFDADDFSGFSPEEKALWNEYCDSMGFGVFDISDEKWDSIAKEIAINAPLILISGGVANGAIKGLSMGARSILPGVIAQVGAHVGTRISAYVVGKVALKTAQIALAMGVEGASFEIVYHALADGDLNMFNKPGWQSKILWSSLTLGAFKGVGKLQQTALLKSFAEKIATGSREFAQLPGLNKVLAGFPVGMQSGFGKILYGMTAFEASRQMETSVMFLTGAAQATLSGEKLDDFYANLYDYCVTNGGENYFHSMVSAHALNLAHTGTSALGKKIKDKLKLHRNKQPSQLPLENINNNELFSGNKREIFIDEINHAGDGAARVQKKIDIVEQIIYRFRGEKMPITPQEKEAVRLACSITPSERGGVYSHEESRKVGEFLEAGFGTPGGDPIKYPMIVAICRNVCLNANPIEYISKQLERHGLKVDIAKLIKFYDQAHANGLHVSELTPLEILRGVNIHIQYPNVTFENTSTFKYFLGETHTGGGEFSPNLTAHICEFASRERNGIISINDLQTIKNGSLCKDENITDRVRAEFSQNNSQHVSLLDSPYITPEPIFKSQRERYDFMIKQRRSMYNSLVALDIKVTEKLSPEILEESPKVATERIVTEILKSSGETISRECMARMLFGTRKCIEGYQHSLRLMNKFKDGTINKHELLCTLFATSKEALQEVNAEHIDAVRIELSPIGGLIVYAPGSLRKAFGDEISDNYVTEGFMRVNDTVGTVTVIYTDVNATRQESTLRHEEEHRMNSFLFPEKQDVVSPREEMLSRTKDEILAFATGGDLSPKEFLPGGSYFEKYKTAHGDFPGIELEICDAMMIHSLAWGTGISKGLFQFTPLSKWRTELTRLGVKLPPKTIESHTAYLSQKYPGLQKYFGDQSILEKIPGKPPYNINALIYYMEHPPGDLQEAFIFKLYGRDGLELLKQINTKGKSLERLDNLCFVGGLDFLIILNEMGAANLANKISKIVVLEKDFIKQNLGVDYLGELTGIQKKELIEGITRAFQEHPNASEREIVILYLQSRRPPQ